MIESLALITASCALIISAVWANFPLVLVQITACLPLLPALFGLFRSTTPTPQFLWLDPHKPCEISDFDKKNSHPVEITQQWQHFFGLTLSLKILNCPHNKQETVRMTVWRCNITHDVYRRMRVIVAWRLDQLKAEQKMETV